MYLRSYCYLNTEVAVYHGTLAPIAQIPFDAIQQRMTAGADGHKVVTHILFAQALIGQMVHLRGRRFADDAQVAIDGQPLGAFRLPCGRCDVVVIVGHAAQFGEKVKTPMRTA